MRKKLDAFRIIFFVTLYLAPFSECNIIAVMAIKELNLENIFQYYLCFITIFFQ